MTHINGVLHGRGGSCTQCQSCDRAAGCRPPQRQGSSAASPVQPRPSGSGLTTTAAPAGQCPSRDVVLYLRPGAFQELVALRSGAPPPTFVSHNQDKTRGLYPYPPNFRHSLRVRGNDCLYGFCHQALQHLPRSSKSLIAAIKSIVALVYRSKKKESNTP